MIVGYHLIWTVYGSWLPNDPRGSSSHSIRRAAIADLGELHHGRKRIQPAGRDIRKFYDFAHDVLKHDFLPLADDEIAVVGRTFGDVIAQRSLHVLRLRDPAGPRASADSQASRPAGDDDRRIAGGEPRCGVATRRTSGVTSGLGRAGVEGLSRHDGRRSSRDRVYRRKSHEGAAGRAIVGFCEAV